MTTILFRRIRKDTWKLIIPKELKKLIIMPPKQSVVHTGKSLSEALIFADHGENMLCTTVHNMFSPGLSLEFSCIELVIQ